MTVFVAADDERADAVRALVESWTRSGILTPSLWVSPSGVTAGAVGPPMVQAHLVTAEGVELVDLFEHIGRFRLDIVRVVVAHLVLQDGPAGDQADVSLAARVLTSAIDAALPRRADAGEAGCRLHRAVVVVPVSGAQEVSANVFEPAWDVNVVLSPEDRPDLDRASVFVRCPGNFDGHAAAALAAVGGVLRGVPEGVLDGLTTDSTSRETDAMVARVSIRTVIGQDVVERIAERAFRAEELAPGGPAQVLAWARPASRPDLVTQSAFDHLLALPEWAPAQRPPSEAPEREHQGFLAALGTAALFNLKTVGAVVSWTLSRGRVRIERSATEAIVGAKGGVLVTLGPRPVDDLTRASRRLLERERARVNESMRMEATRVAVPQPTTWTGLRTLSLGLVDGGPLGSFPEPRQASKRELLPASAVVVPPGEAWPANGDDRAVPADDPLAMQDHHDLLEGRVKEAKADLDKAKAALDAAKEARAVAEEKRASAHPPKPSPPSAEGEKDPEVLPEDAAIKRLRARVQATSERHDAQRAYLEAYDVWHTAASTSLLWRLGNDVGQRAREMRRQQEALEKAKAAEQSPPADALKASQRSLMRWWAWTVPLWLAASAWVVFGRFGEASTSSSVLPLTTARMVGALIVLALAAAVLLVAANHRFYKAVRTYEWQLHEQITRLHQEKAAYVHAGQERARYELLYVALGDWVRIIGEVVHRPWSPPASSYEDLPDEVVAALPAAMGVARQAEGNDAIPATVMLAAYRTVYPQGWSSRAFERGYEAWEGEQPDGPGEGHRAVDLDVQDSPVGSRRRLLEYWATGAARVVLTDEAYRRLLRAVREGDIELPDRVVGRIGRYADGESGPEPEFFHATASESTTFATDVFSASARQARRHYVDRSIAWIPASARGAVAVTDVEARECSGPTAVRVDVSRRVLVTDLVPFYGSSAAGTVNADLPEAPDGDGGAWH